jgi:hypothetical protein
VPAYSPQCNPQELVWREVRRQPFGNHDHDSMDAVENALEYRLCQPESLPTQFQPLTGFNWIVNVSLNEKQYENHYHRNSACFCETFLLDSPVECFVVFKKKPKNEQKVSREFQQQPVRTTIGRKN